MCGPISIPFASKMLFNTVKPAARSVAGLFLIRGPSP